MADNVTLPLTGTGDVTAVVSTDDTGTSQVQRVKLAYSANGSEVHVQADADGLLVNLGTNNDVVVTNAGTFVVQIDGDALTALQKIDDIVHVDDAAFTAGTSSATPAMGFFSTDTVDSGDVGVLSMDASRRLLISKEVNNVAGESNLISTNNSTTTPLSSSASFTGTGDDVSAYASITIQLDTDVASATDGMMFEFSSDNTNWDDSYTFTYAATDSARRFQFPVTAQYFRVNFTNGGTGQGHFRVQTIYHKSNVLTSIHRLEDSVSNDRSAQLVKSATIGYDGTDWNELRIDTNGCVCIVNNFTGIDNVPNTLLGAVQDENGAATLMAIASYAFDGTAWDRLRGDATNGLLVNLGSNNDVSLNAGTNAVGKVGHDTTGLGNGVKTVSVAGTDEALAGSTACKWVLITAQTDNTDIVAVGATGVDATVATGTGTPLFPGDSVRIDIDNLANVFVDALVSGEGVRYMYGT